MNNSPFCPSMTVTMIDCTTGIKANTVHLNVILSASQSLPDKTTTDKQEGFIVTKYD